METLATISPKPEPGEWYFVTTNEESTNKIIVTINEHGDAIQDTYHGSRKENYFNPQKTTKEEAGKFLKETILENKKRTDMNSTDRVILKCMMRFYESFFEENLGFQEF